MALQISDTTIFGVGHLDVGLSHLLAETRNAYPPALIFTGELDLWRDESKLYAARLELADLAVRCMPYRCVFEGYRKVAGFLPSSLICV